MPVSQKIYEVISGSAVMVEHANGKSSVYPSRERFAANPSNASIIRLLRINSIREVTPREIPNFSQKPSDTSGSQS